MKLTIKQSQVARPEQTEFGFVCIPTVVPMGDGCFKVMPSKPKLQLTAREAQLAIGLRHRSSLHRLREEGMLPGRRILRRKIVYLAIVVQAYLEFSSHPEADSQRVRTAHMRRVAAIMDGKDDPGLKM